MNQNEANIFDFDDQNTHLKISNNTARKEMLKMMLLIKMCTEMILTLVIYSDINFIKRRFTQ